LRLAVVVTVVLWLPDLYLLARHQPPRAVLVLMTMHLAVAIATYNILVRVAPVEQRSEHTPSQRQGLPEQERSRPKPDAVAPAGTRSSPGLSNARMATFLAVIVVVDCAIGVAVLVSVPTARPSGWLPTTGQTVYLVHAILGIALTVCALAYLRRCHRSTRIMRLSGWLGGIGVAVAGVGGLLAVVHPLRLAGIAFMLTGPVVAAFGYLLPWLDRITEATPTGDG
jgi:hypothetical protein